MTKRMLVDATHPEETRVAIVDSYRDNNRLDDLDFDLASKPVLRGNIYLAKVMRIEPSLQAAFVEYGGNRHGFLPFSEIHADYFRIPVADRPHDEEEEEFPEEPDTAGDEAEDTPLADGNEPESPDGPEDSPGMMVEENAGEDPAEAAPPLAEDSPPSFTPAPASVFGDDELHEGLITDFGNAVVPSMTMTELPVVPERVESVGGDMAERVVRRHRPRYKIQEVLKRGQIMLVQVVKEERGNKGAALTSYLSLAGRYCVLMPNTDHGGGVSRKITNHQDRRRMKEILDQLEIPEGMAVILRTAGMEQEPQEIQRDLDYLLRLWDNIREQTLQSTAPALIYEEANLIKRSVRDLYSKNISEILVAGKEGYDRAREFMAALMPDQLDKIRLYEDSIPLFFRYHVENQVDKLQSPVVQLRSGGYIVINPTEALVAIDVNSGRATRERHIEETALKTNLEAADEIARQLRLRDLAGLIVIDFIDMEDGRNNAAVERRLKEAMKNDRARLQIGRISLFGLLELSRQRLRPSLLEINFEKCPHCGGVGLVRSVDSAALSILRAIEEEGIKQRGIDLTFHVPTKIAIYLLNQKRDALHAIERRYDLHVLLLSDDALVPPDFRLEKARQRSGGRKGAPAVNADQVLADTERPAQASPSADESYDPPALDDGSAMPDDPQGMESGETPQDKDSPRRRFRQGGRDNRRKGNFGNRNRKPQTNRAPQGAPLGDPLDAAPTNDIMNPAGEIPVAGAEGALPDDPQDSSQRRRRRGRRGGRRRGNNGEGQHNERDNRWKPHQRQGSPRQGFSPPAAPIAEQTVFPVNIHDIDTTPRVAPPPQAVPAFSPVERTAAPSGTSRKNPSSAREPASRDLSSAHEIVNPPSDSPKGGWWRRLTGQTEQ
jgi:ribonuclease E